MSTLTAAQKSLIVTVRRGFTVSAKAQLDAADALVTLRSTMSLNAVTTAVAESGAKFAPGRTRINVIVKTRQSLPADVTADEFDAALRQATANNSGASVNANAESVTGESGEAAESGATPVVTVASLTKRIERIVAAGAGLTAADQRVLADAFSAAFIAVVPAADLTIAA